MAAWTSIPRIPTSVSLALISLNPPRRRVTAANVGMTVAAVDIVGVGDVVVRKRCLRAAGA